MESPLRMPGNVGRITKKVRGRHGISMDKFIKSMDNSRKSMEKHEESMEKHQKSMEKAAKKHEQTKGKYGEMLEKRFWQPLDYAAFSQSSNNPHSPADTYSLRWSAC